MHVLDVFGVTRPRFTVKTPVCTALKTGLAGAMFPDLKVKRLNWI